MLMFQPVRLGNVPRASHPCCPRLGMSKVPRIRKATIIFLVLSVFCAPLLAQTPPTHTSQPPAVPTPQPTAHDFASNYQRSGGSLLQATLNTQPDPQQAQLPQVSYIAVPPPQPRVLRAHDLVTIIVREESTFASKGTTDTKKNAALDAAIEEWISLNLSELQLSGGGISSPVPSVKMRGQRNFKGEATVDRTDKLTARITAEIVDVKPNGTLVLQARKRIKTDEEEQIFILTGICRSEDITLDNTVLSTQMYDLEFTKKHTGAVRDSTRRGLLPRLLDLINPF